MSREMTDMEQNECVAITKEFLAVLAQRKPIPAVALAALTNTLLEIVKETYGHETHDEAMLDVVALIRSAAKRAVN